MLNKKQNGGDGYVINVNEAIGGLPAFSRYANNYQPVFTGELLQNGGYSDNCGCGSKDPLVFDLIKQQGGKKSNKITQFDAIRKVSYMLTPLPLEKLGMIIINIFLYFYSNKKPRKAKQLGGSMDQLQSVLAPLGKNNLLVLAGLLLLHYFAVEAPNRQFSGGNPLMGTLTDILAPLGINSAGSSIILLIMHQAFVAPQQKGGNPLKNLIAPLGTGAFIATALLVLLEGIFVPKKQIGGGIKTDKLYNLLAPITFNAFATKSFLDKMANKK